MRDSEGQRRTIGTAKDHAKNKGDINITPAISRAFPPKLLYWIKHDDTQEIVDFENLEKIMTTLKKSSILKISKIGEIIDSKNLEKLWRHSRNRRFWKSRKSSTRKKSSISKSRKNYNDDSRNRRFWEYKEMQTVKELREYGKFLGIRGLWRKNKFFEKAVIASLIERSALTIKNEKYSRCCKRD